MSRKFIVLLILPLVGYLLAGCTQPGGVTPPPGQKATEPASKPPWQKTWDALVAEGKKEGKVAVYSLFGSKTRVALTQAFNQKYGIGVEFSPFARGSDLVAKAAAEARAGLRLVDVYSAGNPTLLITMRPQGLLGPMRQLLVLPEVLDDKAWVAGKLPFTDSQGLALGMAASITRTVAFNTDMVKEGDIKSYRDLLDPRYKGKITMSDPSVTGAGNAIISHLDLLWGEQATRDFLTRLIKDQGAVIKRDPRSHTEEVARGKYAVAIAPQTDIVAEFIALGSPLKMALVEEDNRLIPGGSAIAVPTRMAHPNAGAVFINWLLTAEGQSVFATSYGNPSARVDASTEGINPLLIPVAGKKYVSETEESMANREKWLEISRKIIAESSR